MARRFLEQSNAPNQVVIRHISAYRKEVNFVALDQGSRTGVDVGCVGVELGDVVLGISTEYDMGDDYIITGAVTGSGVVRLSARYDGHLTDGINAPATVCTIVVAHIQKVR